MSRFSPDIRSDLVALRLQGPKILFAAWKVSPEPGTDLRFRLRDGGGILVSEGPARPEGKHYFRVHPQGTYALSLGSRDAWGDFHPLWVSEWVSTMPLHAHLPFVRHPEAAAAYLREGSP